MSLNSEQAPRHLFFPTFNPSHKPSKMPVITRSMAKKRTLDFKMKKRPVSEGFVFPKTTEQFLEEALAKIARLESAAKETALVHESEFADFEEKFDADYDKLYLQKLELEKENSKLRIEISNLHTENSKVRTELIEQDAENEALKKRVSTLTERIRDPFKHHTMSCPF